MILNSNQYKETFDIFQHCVQHPCPCGFLTDPRHECTCSPYTIQRYMAKISGPILDRIDIHVEVPAVHYRDLVDEKNRGDTSKDIRKRVNRAHEIQKDRFRNSRGIYSNARLMPRVIKQYCSIDNEGERIMRRAVDSFGFSARAYHRILKVSRTIADIEGEKNILVRHLSEAIQYRTLDRNLWMK